MYAIALVSMLLFAAPPDEAPRARAAWDRFDASVAAISPFAGGADAAAAGVSAGRGVSFELGPALASHLDHAPGWPPWLDTMRGDSGNVSRRVANDHGSGLPLAAVRLHVWSCEFFAACTRLGRVPIVRVSPLLDTRHARLRRYGQQRFHDDRWLEPIPPGVLGARYIDALRRTMLDVGTASWDELSETATRAEATLEAGGRVIVLAAGLPAHVVDEPFTPFLTDAPPGAGDFVIAIGTTQRPGSLDWPDLDAIRLAGGGVAWVVNTHDARTADLLPGEIVIDLWAPLGDAAVDVEHHDANLGPVSEVVACFVLQAIGAELERR